MLVAATGCARDEGEPPPEPDVTLRDPGVAPVAPGSQPSAGFGASPSCPEAVAVSVNAIVVVPPVPTPLRGPVVQAERTPPAISGGTLLVTRDGSAIVASDPDRDRVYVVDVAGAALRATVALTAGDEPGRLIEDAAGRVHVVLRGAGALATIDVREGALRARRAVCDVPRGIAYEAAADALHVACAEGALVSLPVGEGAPLRALELDSDLRDVIVLDDGLLVSRFRSAELLRVDAQGGVTARLSPASATRAETDIASPCGGTVAALRRTELTPTVSWRMRALPDGSVAVLHQRSHADEVATRSGGYGGGPCGAGIVQSVLTLDAAGDGAGSRVFPTLTSMTLAVDFAADPSGARIAVAAPGLWGAEGWSVRLYDRAQLELDAQAADALAAEVDVKVEAARAAAAQGSGGQFEMGVEPHNERCGAATAGTTPEGQVTAVAFVTGERLAVQTREPAQLYLYDVPALVQAARGLAAVPVPTVIALAADSRQDSGHDLFHLRAGAGIACASCHAEGGDDGHVWVFADLGPRRTQHVRGGLLGTEPLHWGGDMATFAELAEEVFVGRMGGFSASAEQIAAAARWVDLQPALARSVRDADAVERGRVLFASEEVGCARCHAGAALTNNESEDVGTGGPLQVPSLRGVAFRAPYMHDGCAQTLRDRFGPCGGGDRHGTTSALDDAEVQDLIAYLESL